MTSDGASLVVALNTPNAIDDTPPDILNPTAVSPTTPIEFDENAYLAAFDDVIVALDTNEFDTAREHFEVHGRREGRLIDEKYLRALGLGPRFDALNERVPVSIDTVICCASGTLLVVGWLDDRESPLASLLISCGGRAWNTTAIGRVKRDDVNSVLQAAPGQSFGFWAVVKIDDQLSASDVWMIRARLQNGRSGETSLAIRMVTETELRSTILSYFASTAYYGNRDVESFLALEAGIGAGLVALNRRITGAIVAGAWVSYHGPVKSAYKGSIIVCLFGKHEFMFIQSALFSSAPGAADYEYIYVSNSPELTEILEKEARNCARIYGISIVLVCLPDNAGFGAANNVAARYARSARLMITNPDVFPRDDRWAERHADIIDSAPAEQTAMFGVPLYYDDGSLMHHGMYFEIDSGISVRPDGVYARPMIRTEHYGKGAPAWSREFVCPRPVSAVTGAFISADRAWFESLGGFNEDFLFGHYEDADLSLKSLAAGRPVWVQDFPLWHMEGKGSTRREAHEGGILVNRWLFTRQWGALIGDSVRGPQPAHPALQLPSTSEADPGDPPALNVADFNQTAKVSNAARRLNR
jgi:GT2 family glycosyltransferase